MGKFTGVRVRQVFLALLSLMSPEVNEPPKQLGMLFLVLLRSDYFLAQLALVGASGPDYSFLGGEKVLLFGELGDEDVVGIVNCSDPGILGFFQGVFDL